ncbi:N-formylglutamate amidohydrolase [Paracoccus sanguinis]|uniref:N-formylglutamate amidohydrolase n=1 Tax=Paracoccus sanguinis TaxID=1545044 RepID=UPI0009DEC94B|nr:N-formylglutamate amidohydrolase [Paracoccus sanguinis]
MAEDAAAGHSGGVELTRPARWRAGVVLASPHSGRDYPPWFLAESVLDPLALRSSEDAYVDRLIAPAVAAGAVTLAARVPRVVVDLNRGPDDLDPAAIDGLPPRRLDARILSGLGVVPRVVARGRPIRHGKLSEAEARRRIEAYWRPYHAALAAVMDEAVATFGRAVLIDVHSMPREALSHLNAPRPDIVLGDRNGASADPGVSARVHGALTGAGFRVRRNSPFAGAFVAAAYGRPGQNRHVVQIEIDRGLYLDEAMVRPHAGYAGFADRFARVVAELAGIAPAAPGRIAAE